LGYKNHHHHHRLEVIDSPLALLLPQKRDYKPSDIWWTKSSNAGIEPNKRFRALTKNKRMPTFRLSFRLDFDQCRCLCGAPRNYLYYSGGPNWIM